MPIQRKQTKQVQKFRTLDDMRKFYAKLNEMESDGEELTLLFNMDYYSENVCSSIVDVVEKVARVGFKPQVMVHNNNLEFERAEIQNFLVCEDVLSGKGFELYVGDGDNLYTVGETMSAYAKARAIADEIASHEGSPFEKFIEIYDYVTSFIYKENFEDKTSARDIISILNGDDIVCVGYSKILKYLCSVAKIDCKCVRCDIFDKEGNYTSSHRCNLIYIKDEKYGLDGYYHVDACWDSVKENRRYKTYNYCMMPIEDVKHYAKKDFRFYDEAEILYSETADWRFDYFKDISKLKKTMNFYGVEFDSMMPGVTVSAFNEKRDRAIWKLFQILKSNNIPEDIYEKTLGLSGLLEIDSLIALCMDYEKNKRTIDLVLERMKELYGESRRTSKSYNKDEYIIYNIYNYLNDRRQSKATVVEAGKIREAQLIIKNQNMLSDRIEKIKESSKPITIKKYAAAVKHKHMISGMSEKEAEEYSKKSIIATTKLSAQKFDDEASNTFKKKSLSILKQNGS